MNQFSVKPMLADIQLSGLQVSANEFSYILSQKDKIIGYTGLDPICQSEEANALWLHKPICHQSEANSQLIQETLMYSWEAGYDAVFAEAQHDFLLKEGFVEIESKSLHLNLKDKKVLAYELSWEGLKKFLKPAISTRS